MNAEQFFHVCRSSAAIADASEVTVFGAAAVVPWIAELRERVEYWPSMELDVDPGGDDRAELVEGSIGEGSLFEETFAVHAHGVTLDAFIAPRDWIDRARVWREPLTGIRVRVPHPVDLAAAKLVRGEERDWAFARYCRDHLGVSRYDLEASLAAIEEQHPTYAQNAAVARSTLGHELG